VWKNRNTAASIVNIRYYLLGAVKNQLLKQLNKKDNQTLSFEREHPSDFSAEASAETKLIEQQLAGEQTNRIREVLLNLPPRQREIIYLRFYQQLTPAQIAELMSISPQSVYNLLHESLNRLRGNLQPESFLKVV